MKNTILLSIHPSHVDNILKGTKRFELRRKIPLTVKQIVIYATAPESRIVAIADIENIIVDSPQELWSKVRGASGIDLDFFNNYFYKKNIAYALQLGRVHLIERKISLSHPRLRITPPQSFRYLNENQVSWLLDCADPIVSKGTKRIFIGGIHGSGKSYLSEKIISSYGYHCIAASKLIKDGKGVVSDNKTVTNIDFNQQCLLSGLKVIQGKYSHIAIDGHFCLINAEGAIEEIPIEIFKSINPELIILANPSVTIIKKRLNERPTKLNLQHSIANFKKKEIAHAKNVAKNLAVPLEIIDTAGSNDLLHTKVKNIFITIKR